MGAYRLGDGLVVKEMVIELDDVSLGWRGGVAVRGVSGGFRRGSLTAVFGPNGAGKSTLLKGIVGLLNPLKGRISLADDPRRGLAFLPQANELDRSFPITVYDLVAMGAWRRVGAWGRFTAEEHERIERALEAVHLSDFRQRIIGTLSGGQLQRALFARLLLHDAHTLLLDEPFAAVDRDTTEDLMKLLATWHDEGRTVVVVLHDLEMVRAHFPETLLLAGQTVAWGKTASVLTPENLHLARHLCAGDFL
ncbi:MAG TPA: zinc ABC transporter ATP-binding protein AztA [Pusillimonas sp.]|uniref:zinc ABC transporter ATP-binding protein AztA n=1 Tax=Pusillimonas sp. TaxID=3040095 RepID=UPI002C6251B7|nr:zinc ABC transporter ATP-binding protein AztA [Pusillimonas sp.]HUH87899.1 zinc ABC transporter ATP-binding protein AztA [Pusillimonas sp.]